MDGAEPSPFLAEQAPALARAAGRGPVLDVACGRGRNALAAARHGARVVGVDRDAGALGILSRAATAGALPVLPVRADLERGLPAPVRPGSCGGVLVFRYLHRPLAAQLAGALRPGGLLLYETFTLHQRELGYGPGNPAFLLEPGELRSLFPGLRVLSYWEGTTPGPKPWALARLAAERPG